MQNQEIVGKVFLKTIGCLTLSIFEDEVLIQFSFREKKIKISWVVCEKLKFFSKISKQSILGLEIEILNIRAFY